MTAETAGIVAAAARDMDAPRKEEEEEEMEENFIHMCKICKKKFVSGRAFGGHMRIHGPVATAHAAAEKGQGLAAGKAEGGEGGFDAQDGSAMYALRRHRKRSWRISDHDFSLLMDGDDRALQHPAGGCSCEACGRDFGSWKSLIGHMKCHADPLWKTREDAGDRDWECSQESERPAEEEEDGESGNEIESPGRQAANSGSFERWMKGKRSKRPRHARDYQAWSDNSEEEDVAMCLVMLSRGGRCGSAARAEGKESERPKKPKAARQPDGDPETSRAGSYECATCNKVFHSHQALGGHRASHKKAWHHGNESPEEEITKEKLIAGSDRRVQRPAPKDASSEESCGIPPKAGKGRVHECSICHRVFPTGQALGGHKRCHWMTPGGASETTSTVSSTRDVPLQQRPAGAGLLDLNEPAPAEEDHCAPTEDAAKGVATMDSRRPPSADVESRSKFGPLCFPPWVMGGYYPMRGLFLYNGHRQLSPDDEADSRPGARIGFGGPQPWLVS